MPWPVLLPSYLPLGFDKIGSLEVQLGPAGLPQDAAARRTRVALSFIGAA